MSVKKRGRAWEVRLQINGQKIRQSLGVGSTRQDALELEGKIRGDAINGRLGKAPERTIDEAILRWLEGPATVHKDKQGDFARARAWRMFTNGRMLSDAVAVSSKAVDAWLAAGLTPATINRRLALLRRVLRLCHSPWGWLDEDICGKIDALTGETARDIYLTREQVMSLVHNADNALGDAILLSAYTGLRKSELLALKPSDVVDGCVVVRSGKTKTSERIIPVPAAARAILKRLPIKLGYDELDRAFRVARKAAGLDVRFHDLRHTYGSWLAQSGAAPVMIRDLMGHSTLQVTSRYVHSAPEHLRKAVRRLK